MTDTIPSAAERIVLRLSKEFDETPEHIAQLVIAINEGCSAPRLAWHPEETRAYSGDRRMSPERVHDIARRFEEIKLLEEHRSVAFSKLEAAGRLDETLQQAVLRASNLQTIDRILAEQGIGGSLVPAYVQGAAEARDKGLERARRDAPRASSCPRARPRWMPPRRPSSTRGEGSGRCEGRRSRRCKALLVRVHRQR
jgi:hypothetical protein